MKQNLRKRWAAMTKEAQGIVEDDPRRSMLFEARRLAERMQPKTRETLGIDLTVDV